MRVLFVTLGLLVCIAQDVGAAKPHMKVSDGYGMRCLVIYHRHGDSPIAVSCVPLRDVAGCYTTENMLRQPQCYVGPWRDTVPVSFGDKVKVQ